MQFWHDNAARANAQYVQKIEITFFDILLQQIAESYLLAYASLNKLMRPRSHIIVSVLKHQLHELHPKSLPKFRLSLSSC